MQLVGVLEGADGPCPRAALLLVMLLLLLLLLP